MYGDVVIPQCLRTGRKIVDVGDLDAGVCVQSLR